MRRGQRLSNVGTGAETRIDQPARLQRIERSRISVGPLGLDQHRLTPLEPEPAQILEDPVDELGPATGLVEILDPQPEFAPAERGPVVADDRAERVTEVEPAAR